MTDRHRLLAAALSACLASAGLGATAAPAADLGCKAGTERCPQVMPLRRGGPPRTVHGRIRTPGDRFAYVFDARRGATLVTRFAGPATRLVLAFPDGGAEGPGFPERLRLPQTGRYRLTVSPDLMAEGIVGRFALTLQLR